jgi:hypothetical protein
LPDNVPAVTEQLHRLVLRIMLSESNERGLTIPFVKREMDISCDWALIFPLNAAKIWYLH